MVRAYTSLRIPGPDRLPLRLQHLWDDIDDRPSVSTTAVAVARGRAERLGMVDGVPDDAARDRHGYMTVA